MKIKKIVILGGGTSGWMAAATLSERYKDTSLKIELVESDQIASVGVGEATVPGIIRLHQHLGISEREFIAATGATFKLGIEFKDWYRQGTSFFHPFAAFGVPLAGQAFYQCWLKLQQAGERYSLEDFCLAIELARQGKFAQPDDDATTPLALYSYAYHFDASRYAKFLRQYAETRAVNRTEGKVQRVLQHEDGRIRALKLESGAEIEGDLFIDCSGFRALLIGQALETPYENWQHWLPCDRAVTVQTEIGNSPSPYTRSTALEAGWQWRIPLMHRCGNGYVYCSKFLDEERAQSRLLEKAEERAINSPRVIKFEAGMREQFWSKNVVALGLASGFIEPLESTSISLIQTGIEKLMQFLPDLNMTEERVKEANRLNRLEYERIRDFIILHYKASRRDDSEFWRMVSDMPMPDSLAQKIAQFEHDGSVLLGEQESFQEQSWIAMYNGFQVQPKRCKPELDTLDIGSLKATFEKIKRAIQAGAMHAPSHSDFLKTVLSEAH
jgi:tryptophan halogenase